MDARVRPGEFHMAVELRPLRLVGDPGARGHRLAGAESAQIIDLVPHPDPDIGVLVALWRRGVPMRGRNLLHPLDPDGVVALAELEFGRAACRERVCQYV